MSSKNDPVSGTKPGSLPAMSPSKPLPPAAQRALAEAQARREALAAEQAKAAPQPKEFNGRDGLDPARYGDWETKGIASDF